ncbi:MAG: hypothetical protein M3121_08035 [Chloroflexota bacterium]|nr:hypothetical protein [Chloroflexota bacterium]
MPRKPWSNVQPTPERFEVPERDYGIYPFWFLNGELDPEEMRYQLREFREKGMPGIILHGRFGLELPYLGPDYREGIKLAIEEATRLGLTTWIYDEMNWPSGTADGQVLRERPDLAQRYLECLSFSIRGPWFAYLTGGDSRYIDFERSTPVAAFALSEVGEVVDLTPMLSFENVIPWEVPAGNWQLMYIVEKRADYYIDALDPESTSEFLRVGYEPYLDPAGRHLASSMVGFYTDEPAMHYFVTGGENPIVPWTKEMFRRFHERNGYNLRTRLPDLFFDISSDSARVRHDFYSTLTAFYSDAYYRQIREWCQAHDILFTGHLLYEENLRKMVRVEGNPFSHYRHLDVVGVDHLYPILGDRDRPSEHVAMKLASSAAHQLGSERVLCESFGGIFMDATMQRMKWITDWEYVLGVNLLNPHGFHYTLEGPRKRDWPPSMFYQYPWWHFYGEFSSYVSRLSQTLSGGHHVAKVAVLWPINDIFATYTPQRRNALANRTEFDFDTLTDLLLRLHHDFDYLDEDFFAEADIDGGLIRIRDEAYELLILPPMQHLKLRTVDILEQFVADGGRVLGTIFLPGKAIGHGQIVDVSDRISALFGVDPAETVRNYASVEGIEISFADHPGGGRAGFVRSYALSRLLPRWLQEAHGTTGEPYSDAVVVEEADGITTYWHVGETGGRQDITVEVRAEREEVMRALGSAIGELIQPDVVIDNPEVFYLHRVKEGRELYFFVNPTYAPQHARVTLSSECRPLLWEASTGKEWPIAPWSVEDGTTTFDLALAPTGSAFVIPGDPVSLTIDLGDAVVTELTPGRVRGYITGVGGYITVDADETHRHEANGNEPVASISLEGEWEFQAEDENALPIDRWLATEGSMGVTQALDTSSNDGWLPMVPGAWEYQLPSEPDQSYPIDVWYRMTFRADYLPPVLHLVIDGFAGAGWKVFVNGEEAHGTPERSHIDSQMRQLDITSHVRQGQNLVVLGLTVTGPTDGVLDLLKITGDFSLKQVDDSWHIVSPRTTLRPESWTGQGYPFYSGRGVYRRTLSLPPQAADRRIILQPQMADDVLEVVVNGTRAGVRLWTPYHVDITGLVQPGENTVELRVANTLINLLEAVQRHSGLAGAPRVDLYEQFDLDLSSVTARRGA